MLGIESVRVRTRASIDTRGNSVAAGDPITIDGCAVFPLVGTELIEATRDGATEACRVLIPVTEGITGQHELEVRGRWWRIVGDTPPFVSDEDPDLSGYDLTCTRGRG